MIDLHKFNTINTVQDKEILGKGAQKASLMHGKQVTDLKNLYKFRKNDGHESPDVQGGASLCAGTPLYQAPEQTMNEVNKARKANEQVYLTDKADMFAAGLILYEMCANFRTQH